MGQNDYSLSAATVTSWITSVRSVWASTRIFCIPSLALPKASIIQTGVTNSADANAFYGALPSALYIPGIASFYSYDAASGGSHPNVEGQRRDATQVTQIVQSKVGAPRQAQRNRSSLSRLRNQRSRRSRVSSQVRPARLHPLTRPPRFSFLFMAHSCPRTPVFFFAITAALAVFAVAGRKRQLMN